MDKAYVLSEEFNAKVKAVVAEVLRGSHGQGKDKVRPTPPEMEVLFVQLNEDLTSATASLTDPSTAEATVLNRDGSTGELSESSVTIEVTNRDESLGMNSGDFLRVIWINGEWQILSGGGGGANVIRFQIYECDCETRSAIAQVHSWRGSIPEVYTIDGETELDEQGETQLKKFVNIYDKTGAYLNESAIALAGRYGYATYLYGRPKYTYQPWLGWEVTAINEQQTECENL